MMIILLLSFGLACAALALSTLALLRHRREMTVLHPPIIRAEGPFIGRDYADEFKTQRPKRARSFVRGRS